VNGGVVLLNLPAAAGDVDRMRRLLALAGVTA
jgi:hypothetical protein